MFYRESTKLVEELRRRSLPHRPVNKGKKKAGAQQLRPYDGVPTRGRGETPLPNLLAHHERMGSHVPEALVLS
jgi:hypothetical protein